MYYYLVNRHPQDTGDHEMHVRGCGHSPVESNRIYLGYFEHGRAALKEAKTKYEKVDGCAFCCPECHQG